MNQDPRLADLRNYLAMVWAHKELPRPSKGQFEIADIIQNVLKHSNIVPLKPEEGFLQKYPLLQNDEGGCVRRVILEAYRGYGKSWMCSAITAWILYWNPNRCIMAASGTDNKAKEFTSFALGLIKDIPDLQHLYPDKSNRDRSSTANFDVRGHTKQAPSVRAAAILGNLTGGRADVVFPDDIETLSNSKSVTTRDELRRKYTEIGQSIINPGGVIIVLGTPQCEETIYEEMVNERGYAKMVFPARIPSDKWMQDHGSHLIPYLRERVKNEGPAIQTGRGLTGLLGIPTDPERFDEAELLERETEGRSEFQLQFMLDTSLSDAFRYPLKISDLICMECDKELAPERIYKGKHPDRIWKDLPTPSMKGSRFYHPMEVASERLPYTGSVMFIDPSGMGVDETSYAVVKTMNGWLYLTRSGGFVDGFGDETMIALANIAKEEQVNEILCERNYGGGTFDKLLETFLRDIYRCVITEGPHHTGQKELRIIETLEPLLNQGLLVVDPQVVLDDMKPKPGESPQLTQRRSLFHQMAFITRDQGSLHHDDRLDALTGAVTYWINALGIDVERRAVERKKKAMTELAMSYSRNAVKRFQSKQKKNSFLHF